MKYIDPLSARARPLVLAELYPFNRDKSSKSVLSSALLRMQCIVQDECTIPGSLLLQDEQLGHLVRRNVELIESGAITPDLRNTVESYRELAQVKFGPSASNYTLEMADFLDRTCPAVLHFDPNKSSNAYKEKMSEFLSGMMANCKNGHEYRSIQRLIDRLSENETYLSFEDAAALKTNIQRLDARILAAAKFLYCVCGSATINGTLQVPLDLWRSVHAEILVTPIDQSPSSPSNDLSIAHAAILDHFAVNPEAFNRLLAKDIVKLRADGATRIAVRQIKETSEKIETEFFETGRINSINRKHIEAMHIELEQRIRSLCKQQVGISAGLEIAGFGIEEIISDAIPFSNVLKKTALKVGRTMSHQSPKLARTDFTLAPICTYVSRLQNFIGSSDSMNAS